MAYQYYEQSFPYGYPGQLQQVLDSGAAAGWALHTAVVTNDGGTWHLIWVRQL